MVVWHLGIRFGAKANQDIPLVIRQLPQSPALQTGDPGLPRLQGATPVQPKSAWPEGDRIAHFPLPFSVSLRPLYSECTLAGHKAPGAAGRLSMCRWLAMLWFFFFFFQSTATGVIYI